MNFPLRTAFAVSHKFWNVLSSCSLFPKTSWFLSWSHSWPIHCLIACYLISMFLCVRVFFSLRFVSGFSPLWSEKIWFLFSWTRWDFFCVLSCALSLKIFHVHLKRICVLLFWDERFSLSFSVYIYNIYNIYYI